MRKDYIKGLQRALEIAKMHADENMRMADDTISLDPILNHKKRSKISSQAELDAASKISDKLAHDGAYYAARSHSAKDIADEIVMEIRRA